jgi:hypothetical protein
VRYNVVTTAWLRTEIVRDVMLCRWSRSCQLFVGPRSLYLRGQSVHVYSPIDTALRSRAPVLPFNFAFQQGSSVYWHGGFKLGRMGIRQGGKWFKVFHPKLWLEETIWALCNCTLCFVCQEVDGKILCKYGCLVQPLLICFRIGYFDEDFVKGNDMVYM